MIIKALYRNIIFLLALTSYCSSQNSVTIHSIVEGQSLDDFIIKKIKLEDIQKKYGKGKLQSESKKMELENGSYTTVKTSTLSYTDMSLQFVQNTIHNSVYLIVISFPYEVKTSSGIVMGKTNLTELFSIMGRPENRNGFSKNPGHSTKVPGICCDSIYSYSSKGIDFTINCDTAFTTNGKTKSEINKNIKCYAVKKITIYEPIR